jgi:hypothetical protein
MIINSHFYVGVSIWIEKTNWVMFIPKGSFWLDFDLSTYLIELLKKQTMKTLWKEQCINLS